MCHKRHVIIQEGDKRDFILIYFLLHLGSSVTHLLCNSQIDLTYLSGEDVQGGGVKTCCLMAFKANHSECIFLIHFFL